MNGYGFYSPPFSPLAARITAPSGPPSPGLFLREGAAVLALPQRYCVTYLVLGRDGVAIVDVGSNADVPAILGALEWAGRSAADVRCVVATHLHFDHVMGLNAFALRTGAPIRFGRAAAALVGERRPARFPPGLHLLRSLPTWLMQGMPFPPASDWKDGMDYGMPWGRNRFTAPIGPALEDGASLPGLEGWIVLETPGHADEAICLYHPRARYLIAGDTVRNFFGGEWNPLSCDPEGYGRTKERLKGLDVAAVFPGHGPVLEGAGLMSRLRTLSAFSP